MRRSPVPAARAVIATLLLGMAGTARAGETLETDVTREGRVLQVRATLGADVPAAACYAVLADFDHLEDFVPGVKSSDVISAPGEPILLRQVGEARAGFFRVTLDVTLAVTVQPPERIDFDRTAGNLKQMRGGWLVTGDASHCDVAYRADIQPGFWVPPLIGPLLMRNQVEAQLEGVLAEIRRRNASTNDATP